MSHHCYRTSSASFEIASLLFIFMGIGSVIGFSHYLPFKIHLISIGLLYKSSDGERHPLCHACRHLSSINQPGASLVLIAALIASRLPNLQVLRSLSLDMKDQWKQREQCEATLSCLLPHRSRTSERSPLLSFLPSGFSGERRLS